MKFAVLTLFLLVAVCCPLQSLADKEVDEMLRQLHKTKEHGVLSKIKGFFGAIKQMVTSKDGSFNIDGTPLVMKFHAHHCKLKFGKRMLLGKLVKCKAEVTETFTGIKRECSAKKQTLAVECAAKAILEKIKENVIRREINWVHHIHH